MLLTSMSVLLYKDCTKSKSHKILSRYYTDRVYITVEHCTLIIVLVHYSEQLCFSSCILLPTRYIKYLKQKKKILKLLSINFY